MWFRSFQKPTVGLCRPKGCRAESHQFGGCKRKCRSGREKPCRCRTQPDRQTFSRPSTLMACSSASIWPTESHSTILEGSKPCCKHALCLRGMVVALRYFMVAQNTSILHRTETNYQHSFSITVSNKTEDDLWIGNNLKAWNGLQRVDTTPGVQSGADWIPICLGPCSCLVSSQAPGWITGSCGVRTDPA